MADKTVADKLLIKPGASVWVSDEGRRSLIGPTPDGVDVSSDPSTASTAIVVADDAASVRKQFATNATALLGIGEPLGPLSEGEQGRHQPRLALADPVRVRLPADQPGLGRRYLVGAPVPSAEA